MSINRHFGIDLLSLLLRSMTMLGQLQASERLLCCYTSLASKQPKVSRIDETRARWLLVTPPRCRPSATRKQHGASSFSRLVPGSKFAGREDATLLEMKKLQVPVVIKSQVDQYHALARGKNPIALSAVGSPNATRQVQILGHNGDTFTMNSTQVGIFKETDQMAFRRLLQGQHGRALPTVRFVHHFLLNFPHQTSMFSSTTKNA
jgi:hypothetical protein